MNRRGAFAIHISRKSWEEMEGEVEKAIAGGE